MRATKLIVVIALLAVGCATGPNPKPNPCIGPASARPTMPCTCPASLSPDCYPFPQDAKRKKKATPPAPAVS